MVMMHKLNSPQANDSIKALLILKRYSWAFPVPLILPSFPKAAMLSLLAFWRVIFRPAWCTITPGPLHSKNHTVRSGRMIRLWQCSRLAPASSQSLQFDSKPVYFVHNFCHDTLFFYVLLHIWQLEDLIWLSLLTYQRRFQNTKLICPNVYSYLPNGLLSSLNWTYDTHMMVAWFVTLPTTSTTPEISSSS